MAQAPTHISSPSTTPQSSKHRNSLSYIKEKTKLDLFQAIEDQNILHGEWQKKVKDWYKEKIEKMMERTHDRKIAKELASKQIKKIWARVWKDKLATPGTKGGADFYKKVGDSDGEGALFLIKKFIFGKRFSFNHYLTHEEIETYAQSTDLSDKNVLRMFLDGGQVPGFSVLSKEGKGLRSAWTQAKIVADHHPEGPTSTTGIVAKLLQITDIIPATEKKAVEKFVKTIDIVDSFLSKAGRAIHVEKEYAKTLCSLSYLLDSDELYEVCTKLPDHIGPLTPIPDNLLQSIEVKPKGKDTKVKLQEMVNKKQVNIDTGILMLKEKLRAKQFVTLEGKKFIIFGPKDNISNDVRATLSAEHDYGTIKVHESGELFIVHDEGIPSSIKDLGLTVRDVIFLFNPHLKTFEGKSDLYEANKKKLYSFFHDMPDSEGKTYILSLLSGENKTEQIKPTEKETTPVEEKKPGKEEVKKSDAVVKTKEAIKETLKENKIEENIALLHRTPPQKIEPIAPVVKEIGKDFGQFGTDLKGLWSSFTKSFRKKQK